MWPVRHGRAVGALPAGAAQITDPLAATVQAGLVVRAVGVGPASDNAPLALADLSQRAVPVLSALWQHGRPAAQSVGVAAVPRGAGAHPVVVDGPADGVAAARPVHGARVLADMIDAGLLELAVAVCSAALDAVGRFADLVDGAVQIVFALNVGLCHPALDVSVPSEVAGAGADGAVVVGVALGTHAAAVGQQARVLALPVHASQMSRAVVVMAASRNAPCVLADVAHVALLVDLALGLHLLLLADNIGVAAETTRARALGLVIDRSAVGVASAGTKNRARVLTYPIDTSLIGTAILISMTTNHASLINTYMPKRTLRVGPALGFFNNSALDPSVTQVPGIAGTDGSVVVGHALCVDAAHTRLVAYLIAAASDAGRVGRTLVVAAATLVAFSSLTDETGTAFHIVQATNRRLFLWKEKSLSGTHIFSYTERANSKLIYFYLNLLICSLGAMFIKTSYISILILSFGSQDN